MANIIYKLACTRTDSHLLYVLFEFDGFISMASVTPTDARYLKENYDLQVLEEHETYQVISLTPKLAPEPEKEARHE